MKMSWEAQRGTRRFTVQPRITRHSALPRTRKPRKHLPLQLKTSPGRSFGQLTEPATNGRPQGGFVRPIRGRNGSLPRGTSAQLSKLSSDLPGRQSHREGDSRRKMVTLVILCRSLTALPFFPSEPRALRPPRPRLSPLPAEDRRRCGISKAYWTLLVSLWRAAGLAAATAAPL